MGGPAKEECVNFSTKLKRGAGRDIKKTPGARIDAVQLFHHHLRSHVRNMATDAGAAEHGAIQGVF